MNLETLPITIEYSGCVPSPWEGANLKVDMWKITLTKGRDSWSTPYYTGLGLRSPRTGPSLGVVDREHLESSRQPVKPTNARVLNHLILDASAADENFDDWCSSYGYSNASIKMLNTYKKCLGIASALQRFFTREELEEIKALTEDM